MRGSRLHSVCICSALVRPCRVYGELTHSAWRSAESPGRVPRPDASVACGHRRMIGIRSPA